MFLMSHQELISRQRRCVSHGDCNKIIDLSGFLFSMFRRRKGSSDGENMSGWGEEYVFEDTHSVMREDFNEESLMLSSRLLVHY